jgi:hypothetical protein
MFVRVALVSSSAAAVFARPDSKYRLFTPSSISSVSSASTAAVIAAFLSVTSCAIAVSRSS